MGLLDSIVGALGGAEGEPETGKDGAAAILGSLLQQGSSGQSGNIVGQLLGGLGGGSSDGTAGGGMQSVLTTLAENGLADEVGSWLSNSTNLPISPEQIASALGSDQVQQMAAASGLPIGDFLKHLAEHLPQAASDASGAAAP